MKFSFKKICILLLVILPYVGYCQTELIIFSDVESEDKDFFVKEIKKSLEVLENRQGEKRFSIVHHTSDLIKKNTLRRSYVNNLRRELNQKKITPTEISKEEINYKDSVFMSRVGYFLVYKIISTEAIGREKDYNIELDFYSYPTNKKDFPTISSIFIPYDILGDKRLIKEKLSNAYLEAFPHEQSFLQKSEEGDIKKEIDKHITTKMVDSIALNNRQIKIEQCINEKIKAATEKRKKNYKTVGNLLCIGSLAPLVIATPNYIKGQKAYDSYKTTTNNEDFVTLNSEYESRTEAYDLANKYRSRANFYLLGSGIIAGVGTLFRLKKLEKIREKINKKNSYKIECEPQIGNLSFTLTF